MSALNALLWRVRGQMVALSRGYRCRRSGVLAGQQPCARWWRVGVVRGQIVCLVTQSRTAVGAEACSPAEPGQSRALVGASFLWPRSLAWLDGLIPRRERCGTSSAVNACSKISQLASYNTLATLFSSTYDSSALGTVALTARLHAHSTCLLVALVPAKRLRETCARISKAHQCWR